MQQSLQSIVNSFNKCGVSRAELAAVSGVSLATVYRLLDGQTMYPRWQTVTRIAFAAGFVVACQRRARRAS